MILRVAGYGFIGFDFAPRRYSLLLYRWYTAGLSKYDIEAFDIGNGLSLCVYIFILF